MKKLDPKIWADSFEWKYEAYPFFTSVYMKAALPQTRDYYVQWANMLNYFNDGQSIQLLPKKEQLEQGYKTIDELLNGNEAFVRTFEELYGRMEKAIRVCLESRERNAFSDFNTWWPNVHTVLSDVTNVLFSFDFTLNEYMRTLQEKDPEAFEKLQSSIREEKVSFINEANKYLKTLIDQNKKFEEIYPLFIKKFGWFQNSYKGPFHISKEWLKNYADKLHGNDATSHETKVTAEYQSLLAKTASRAISFRDDKKKLLLVAVDLMDGWLREISEKNNLNHEELKWLAVGEVQDILNGHKPNIIKAKAYNKNKIRVGMMGENTIKDISLELWNQIRVQHTAQDGITEIKGMIGNKGKISGTVKVILDPKKDEANFKQGEILVTSMTRPEFLPLMSKASAFITDEGGITCHAAIVAREMNKPCIIGTKIATQVLKDGDTVEIDADKGIIRILT